MADEDGIACFMVEPTADLRVGLRRYAAAEHGGWTCEEGWHQALVWIGRVTAANDETVVSGDVHPHDDPAWPKYCDKGCGYEFVEGDQWQRFIDRVWRRADTGEEMHLRDAPPGAMWFADWFGRKGPDGHTLAVKLPNGYDWVIDSRASNCGSPDDAEHRCWCRHGTPPDVTVDKDCATCNAGAGSIGAGSGDNYWHGYLRGGRLVV